MKKTQNEVEELIQLATRGNAQALEKTLHHFHDPLLQFIKQQLFTKEGAVISAEDVLQETFVAAFRGIGRMEVRGQAAFLGWLQQIARTRFLNMVKKEQAQKRGGGRQQVRRGMDATATSIIQLIAGAEATPSLTLRRKEAAEIVAEVLEEMEPERRRIIEWHFGKGKTVAETATLAQKSEGAVRMVIHRTLKDLRVKIRKDFGDFSVSA